MYFSSLSQLMLMDGQGAYVWASYALSFAVLGGISVWAVAGHARATRRTRALEQISN